MFDRNLQSQHYNFPKQSRETKLLSKTAVQIATLMFVGTSGAMLSLAQATPNMASSAYGVKQLPGVNVVAPSMDNNVTEGSNSYTTTRSASATGLNLPLKKTPQSVSVMTRARLEDQNLTNFNEVMDQSVGITRQSYGDSESGYTFYYARGFSVDSYQIDGAITSPATMGGYRGESGLGSRDMAIFDNVTVVRGATGLLNGAGSPSGSISLTRKRPTKHFQGHVLGQAGRWNRYRSELDVSGAFDAQGLVRGRVVAVHTDNGSWQARAHHKKTTLYGVVETDLSPNTTLYGGVEYFRMRANDAVMHGFDYIDTNGDRTNLNGFINAATKASYDDLSRAIIFANIEHYFANGWRAKAEVNHTRVDSDKVYGVVAQAIKAGSNASTITYGKGIDKPKQYGFDVRLDGPFELFGREHEFVAGMNYYNLKRDDPGYERHDMPVDNVYEFDGNVPHQPFVSTFRDKQDARQFGAFAASNLKLTEQLALVVGGRLSSYKSISDKQNESGVFKPYAGLVYEFSPNWSAYTSYTTTFKPQGQKDKSGNTLNPEQGSNIELGIKANLLDDRLTASAALFQTKKDNLAVKDGKEKVLNTDEDAFVAMDDVVSKGWELEVAGFVQPQWQIAAGYTQVQTRDAKRKLLLTETVPEHQFKLFTTYRFDGNLAGLTLGAGLNWQSRVYETSSRYSAKTLALLQEKARVLVSLMARYQYSPQLEFALNIENATDKRYRIILDQHNIGAPRHFNASIKYKF